MHAWLPVVYLPLGHVAAKQAVPVLDEYRLRFDHCPVGHCVHAVLCATGANRPPGQRSHVAEPAAGENKPAAQSEHTVAPAALYLPWGQSEHVDCPADAVNLPAAQLADLKRLPLLLGGG